MNSVKLGKVITLHRGYDLPEAKREAGNVPIISSAGSSGFHNVAKLDGENVITGRYGTIGEVFYFDGKCWPLNTTLYVSDFHGNCPRYAAYLLKAVLNASHIDGKDKSTTPGVDRNALHDLDVPYIENVNEQKAVAGVLGSIDDKIALNKRLCAEIEETAQLIYDYWFTQFDFPDAGGRPYRSSGGKMVYNDALNHEIPEGWDVIKVCDLVSVMKGISYKSDDLFGDGVPMVSLASFNTDGTYRPETIKSYSGKIDERRTVQPGDLIMCVTQQTSIDLTGKTNVIGKALLMPDIFDGVAVISTDVVKLIPSNPLYAYVLERLFRRLDIHKHIVGYANGTKIKHLDVEGALDFYFPMPVTDLGVLATFAQLRMEQAAQYSSLLRENDELIRLRDWLLPMLMNGQVKVCVDGGTHRDR